MNLICLGLGGIFQWLSMPVFTRLAHLARQDKNPFNHILLVDGGDFIERKKERQVFHRCGPKAHVRAQEMRARFPELVFEPVPFYLKGADDVPIPERAEKSMNVDQVIHESDWVLMCVDNPKTRNRVDVYVSSLRNARLINGGNNLTDGAAQIYGRKNGRDLYKPLRILYPNTVGNPDAYKAPYDLSCEDLEAQGGGQIIAANLAAATAMYMLLDLELERKEIPAPEIRFDTNMVAMRPVTIMK